MREERGTMAGDLAVDEDVTLWGSVGGNVNVLANGRLWVRGSVYGNLTVETGGRCHVLGSVNGHLDVQSGAKAIISGVVGGNVTNLGGRLYVQPSGRIMGSVRTRSGETKLPQCPE